MTNQSAANRLRMVIYSITVFASSAVLLVIEITAGRLIAPYVGVTLYSWTSIIGVILAGLSLGNWIGGRMADRGVGEGTVGIVLCASAATSLFSLFVLTQVAPLLQASQLDLMSSSFIYVLSMFLLPSVLLGIPTPLLTTLALGFSDQAGSVVGRMHALAALGSIVGTFLTGFVLVQFIGSRNIILLSAGALVLLALPFLRHAARSQVIVASIALLVVAGLTWQNRGFANPCERETSYYCLRIVDVSDQVPFGEARALIIDHLLHGINHDTEAGMLISPYVHLMQELADRHYAHEPNSTRSYYFAGGGSYTQPRALSVLDPGARVTVAEIDPVVTELAADRMYLDLDGIEVVHGDARRILQQQADRSYDVIVTDAFHDITIPFHLVTSEYIATARERLREGGLFVTNVVDRFPNPRMVKSLVKTLRLHFEHVDIWLDAVPGQAQRMTFVISASDRRFDDDMLLSQRGFDRRWFRMTEPLLASGDRLEELPLFTDDYVPVERLMASLLFTGEGL